MLIVLLAAELVLTLFLAGVLVIAIAVSMRYPTAPYKLHAVRDKLLNACVFDGVRTDDPWLAALYENVDSVLLRARKLTPLPDVEKCPPAIRVLLTDLRSALKCLCRHQMGLYLGMNAHERAQRRLQRKTAKSLLEMIDQQVTRLPLRLASECQLLG